MLGGAARSGTLEFPESALTIVGGTIGVFLTASLVGTVVATATDDGDPKPKRFPLGAGRSPIPVQPALGLFAGVFSLGSLDRAAGLVLRGGHMRHGDATLEVLIGSFATLELLQYVVVFVGIVAGVAYALVAGGSPRRLGTLAAVGGLVGYAVLGALSVLATFVADPVVGSDAVLFALTPIVTAALATGGGAVVTGLALQGRNTP